MVTPGDPQTAANASRVTITQTVAPPPGSRERPVTTVTRPGEPATVAAAPPAAPQGRQVTNARADAALVTGSTTPAPAQAQGQTPAAPAAATTRDSARQPAPAATGSLARSINTPPDPMQVRGPRQTLAEVLELSLAQHPQIALAQWRTEEARHGVTAAASAARPQIDLRGAAGHSTIGNGRTDEGFWNTTRGLNGNARIDGGLTLRQIIYDFGATANDFARSNRLVDARRLETYDRVEEIGLRVVNAYMRILEQREIVAAADENIAALRRIANLVKQNEKNGNATVADVKRVEARMADAEAQRTDLAAEMQVAMDQFRRLSKVEPGVLQPVATPMSSIPPGIEQAVSLASSRHPRLLALEQQNRATIHELENQRAQSRPRITGDVDANLRNYLGPGTRTEVDVRAMLSLRYRLTDGGMNRALENQIEARINQGALRLRDAREEIEADIRQSYRSIAAARAKFSTLRESRDAAKRVVDLYAEQFRGGKRTLFELLDAQMAYTNARRAVVMNQFEERRALYGILRSTGRLTPTIVGSERQAAAAR